MVLLVQTFLRSMIAHSWVHLWGLSGSPSSPREGKTAK